MFILDITYTRPFDEIEPLVAPHRAYLQRFYDEGLFLVSGPKTPRNGGIIVVREGVSREALEDIARNDPYTLAGVATYAFTHFTPAMFNPGLAAFV